MKMDRKGNPTSPKGKAGSKDFREEGARKSTVDTPHALIGHGLPLVNNLNFEM